MVERGLCKPEVEGSNPFVSTKIQSSYTIRLVIRLICDDHLETVILAIEETTVGNPFVATDAVMVLSPTFNSDPLQTPDPALTETAPSKTPLSYNFTAVTPAC